MCPKKPCTSPDTVSPTVATHHGVTLLPLLLYEDDTVHSGDLTVLQVGVVTMGAIMGYPSATNSKLNSLFVMCARAGRITGWVDVLKMCRDLNIEEANEPYEFLTAESGLSGVSRRPGADSRRRSRLSIRRSSIAFNTGGLLSTTVSAGSGKRVGRMSSIEAPSFNTLHGKS